MPILGLTPLLIAASIWEARFWYALPLAIVVSLVYGATRHERFREIMIHSYRSFLWVVGFMGVIFLVIYVSGYWN